MDQILHYDTGTQSIDGCACVPYCIYGIPSSNPSLPRRAPLNSDQVIACLDAATSVIDRGDVALPNSQLRVVWVFGKSLPKRPDQTIDKGTYTPAPPTSDGYTFQAISSGLLCASELLKKRPAPSHANAPRQSGTGDASPAERPQLETPRVYAAFLSAVIWTVTYILCRDHRAISLNFRTLLMPEPIIENRSTPSPGRAGFLAVALDANLTNTGTLSISFKPLSNRSWRPIQDPMIGSTYSGKIRIAPVGVEARYDPTRAYTSDEGGGAERWKAVVQRWLRSNGIEIEGLDDPEQWVRVGRSGRARNPRAVWWPARLCFAPRRARDLSALDTLDTNTTGTQEDQTETTTPLTFHGAFGTHGLSEVLNEAQEWASQKDARDVAIKALRSAKVEEESEVPVDADVSMLDASSPFNMRHGTMFDAPGTTGIYPTPPDAVLAHAPQGLANDSSNHASDLIGYPSLTEPFARPEEVLSTGPGAVRENLTTSGTDSNIEPFAGDDDDEFVNNDLTEADFSFFDEPDVDPVADIPESTDEMDMPDISAKPDADEQEATQIDNIVTLPIESKSDTKEHEETSAGDVESPTVEFSRPNPTLEIETHHHHADSDSKENKMLLLSPELVKRKLFPHEVEDATTSTASPFASSIKRDNPFEAVIFSSDFLSADSKYNMNGRFAFTSSSRNPSVAMAASHFPPLAVELQELRERGARWESPDTTDESNDTEGSSPDVDDARTVTEVQPLFFGSNTEDPPRGTKRKFVGVDREAGATPGSSNEPPTTQTGAPGVSVPDEMTKASEYFMVDPNSRPLLPASDPEARSSATLYDEKSPTPEDTIAIAQIIASQHMFSSMRASQAPSGSDPSGRISKSPNKSFLNAFRSSVNAMFPSSRPCDFQRYLQIQDVFPGIGCLANMKNHVKRTPGAAIHTPDTNIDTSGLVFPIPPPQVRMRRCDALWDLLPTSLSFWEALGLAPPGGAKNLAVHCVYPSSKSGSDSVAESVENFIDSIGAGYETLKLGIHSKGRSTQFEPVGLIPYSLDRRSSDGQMLPDICIQLGNSLARTATELPVRTEKGASNINDSGQPDNYVIYIVDPFGTTSSLRQICSSFWALFQQYRKNAFIRTMPACPDIVLQVVPLEVVSRFAVSAATDADLCYKLAREVYDRCPPRKDGKQKLDLPIYSAPSIHFEERLAKQIPFKVDKEPPTDLLHDNMHLHVGYSKSQDGNWVTAVWTDNTGKYHTTASYCLYKYRPIVEVIREIWETTLDFLPARRSNWRLCIARSGVMEQDESEAWRSFHFVPSHLQVLVTLVTVDASPYLSITPPESTAAGATGTPVSTPQAGPSPDTHAPTPAATPSDLTLEASADPDAHLIDACDETWGIMLNRRLRNAHSITECRPCLASGLLVKRGKLAGSDQLSSYADDDGGDEFPCVAVNLVWIWQVGHTTQGGSGNNNSGGGSSNSMNDGSPGGLPTPLAYVDTTLKDLLVLYRGLGLLGKLRGLQGTQSGLIPWHVAAAMRGVREVERAFF
ncbi:hypothetical protein P152DRAFT_517562 [Eremomyces bilateralis CBS 781.70]|uniref:Mediator of RNA polymerase II transcription subunit 13 n=1 Tax=Eremomyces bilateralis CBS 781.70 TaxID=1392243 RepID=A0A6G1FRF5_9PEZI|nr:uncharacterized protein P152DRAFT_517562 [Eremomyces bilateralis CBS 781.70]KAF1808425.1 hypothetical protein P152DRAFT_517562 [Eremomyces bilateralis CBS 781.70]